MLDDDERASASERRWRSLAELRTLGVLVVGGLFFGVIAITRIAGLVQNDLNPRTLASLALLGLTALLLALWFWSTQEEPSVLRQVGGDRIPPVPASGFPLVLAAGVFLGALGAATEWPGVFAAMYAGLKAIEYLGLKRINDVVREAFIRVRSAGASLDRLRAIETLELYYFRRPWHRLQLVGLGLALLALALAAAAQLRPNATFDLELAAYVILIAAIVLNEATVAYWRARRTAALPEAYR